VQKDNIVYHGLAGPLLRKGIPHVLKVRIIADLNERLRDEMERERILKLGSPHRRSGSPPTLVRRIRSCLSRAFRRGFLTIPLQGCGDILWSSFSLIPFV
jgi:hypothetical protein